MVIKSNRSVGFSCPLLLFLFMRHTFAQSGSPVLRPPSTPLTAAPDQEIVKAAIAADT